MIGRIMGTDHLTGCPSWHHQAVGSVEDTSLKVTGYTTTDGVDMIESVERTDKTCAFGIQYHPEASVGKYLDDDDNKGDYMDYDSALRLFVWIVNHST
jgi:putative glutamine amidotransferase